MRQFCSRSFSEAAGCLTVIKPHCIFNSDFFETQYGVEGLWGNGMISKSPKFAVGGTLFAAKPCD